MPAPTMQFGRHLVEVLHLGAKALENRHEYLGLRLAQHSEPIIERCLYVIELCQIV
jgi:hypothetical protein